MSCSISPLLRRCRWVLAGVVPLLAVWLPAAAASGAPPPITCLWTPAWVQQPAPPGRASIQYLLLSGTQIMDDQTAAYIAQSLGPDRTLHFQYEQDYPDDHVFPNGITMGQIHQWLTTMIGEWNQEPLMPLQLSLERGNPGTGNVIRLDDTGSETQTNSGIGGYSSQWNGTTTTYTSRAVLNVGPGSLTTRELIEFLAKHELGHCLALSHSANRAAAMGYQNGTPDYWARVGYFEMDDLLGLRAIWARATSGFGALEGHVQYPDGSPLGGADVVAIDDQTGEVLASNVSDGQNNGRFRIELPAGRQVRLVAHPLHADAALFGEHFVPSQLLTPGGFEPTEFKSGDQTAVYTVPDSSTQEIDPVVVDPPADTPLLNKDARVVAMLPGGRAHVALTFDGLGSSAPSVTPTLTGLSVANVTQADNRVEFDVTAAAGAAGASAVEVRSGSAANLQVGTIWVRPLTGLVEATRVDPLTLTSGTTTPVVVSGMGLDQVTGVRVVSENGSGELTAELGNPTPAGGLTVNVDVPADTDAGPWDIQLLTAGGEAPQAPEPRPRLWVTSGRLQADATVDLGDIPVGQPVDLPVQITNTGSDSYQLTSYDWTLWQGNVNLSGNLTAPQLAPGASGTLHLTLTPTQLGPAVLAFEWRTSGVDGVTRVRLWAVPAASGN